MSKPLKAITFAIVAFIGLLVLTAIALFFFLDVNAYKSRIEAAFFSFMSITMPPMIDPFRPVQTHSSLETHPTVQTHTMLEKTAPAPLP